MPSRLPTAASGHGKVLPVSHPRLSGRIEIPQEYHDEDVYRIFRVKGCVIEIRENALEISVIQAVRYEPVGIVGCIVAEYLFKGRTHTVDATVQLLPSVHGIGFRLKHIKDFKGQARKQLIPCFHKCRKLFYLVIEFQLVKLRHKISDTGVIITDFILKVFVEQVVLAVYLIRARRPVIEDGSERL
jgi:hypothetical protein